MRLLPLICMAAVLLASEHGVRADGPTPGNTPAGTPPQATPVGGATPAPTPPPPGVTPAPGATTPAPGAATPAPGATTPAPGATTPAPGATTPAPSSASPAPTTETPEPTTKKVETPKPTEEEAKEINSKTEPEESGGLSGGAIAGIVIAVLAFVGIAGFFVFRHMRSRRQDHYPKGGYDLEYAATSPSVTVLESTHNLKYSSMPSATNPAPPRRSSSADFVIMPQAASMTPSSPKFSHPPQLSPPTYQQESNVADFTHSVSKYEKSETYQSQSQMHHPSQDFTNDAHDFDQSMRDSRVSYAESYAESYAGVGSYVQSFDQGGYMARDTFKSDIGGGFDEEPSTGDNQDQHWMDAMDDMRGTNDSYAMLEGGSFGSRSSAMRFSTDSEFSRRG